MIATKIPNPKDVAARVQFLLHLFFRLLRVAHQAVRQQRQLPAVEEP